MKRKIYIVLLAMWPLGMMAAERSAAQAALLAAEFMNEQVASSPVRKVACNASSFALVHTRNKINMEAPAFYVFNRTGDEGFVVVSADDRTEDVLMYSDEGALDVEKVNPNLRFWLNRLQEEISAANDENTYASADKKQRKASKVTAISPLLKNRNDKLIKWDQEAPYYNQCPQDGTEYSMTGCVATATAQVMYMWRYPKQGSGSHSYETHTKKIKVSQDFSTVTFDWDNMLPTYARKIATKAQKDAVAWLMRCCGVACDMDYASNGSGALTDQMAKGLTTYFDYKIDKFITMYKESDYVTAAYYPAEYAVTTAQFIDYYNADLEAGHPIVMGGEDADGGHEFVCDGRDENGKFHFNWGWEGSCNCYCEFTALKPTGTNYDFSSNLDAIIGLRPANPDTVHVTGVAINPSTATLEINDNVTLAVVVTPSYATIKGVTWDWDDYGVVSVTNAGVVKALGEGVATITATTKDGGHTATCVVTVKAPAGLKDMHELSSSTSCVKMMTNGRLVIVRGNSKYNTQGQLLE